MPNRKGPEIAATDVDNAEYLQERIDTAKDMIREYEATDGFAAYMTAKGLKRHLKDLETKLSDLNDET